MVGEELTPIDGIPVKLNNAVNHPYNDPVVEQCDDTTVQHGEHNYVKFGALRVATWYWCSGYDPAK